jgi:hypothetical protein
MKLNCNELGKKAKDLLNQIDKKVMLKIGWFFSALDWNFEAFCRFLVLNEKHVNWD